MKQFFVRLIYSGIGLCSFLPLRTLAYTLDFDPTVGGVTTPLETYTKLGQNDPAAIVFIIVNYALIFLGMITVILIIVAGFMWLFAAGQEDKIKKAKDILKGAVTGLVITLASYGLAQYLFNVIRYATSGTSATP